MASASRDPRERLAVLRGGGLSPDVLVDMVRDLEEVIGEASLPSGPDLAFEASNIRRERTGIHATVLIRAAGTIVAHTAFNVERDDDRTRLANSAAKRIGNPKELGLPIKARLDEFCRRIWEVWIAGDGAVMATGSDEPAARVLIEPYLTDGGTILYGPGGSGKSWLSMIWALTLHHGLVDPWKATGAVPVLYVDFEDTLRSFRVRLRQAARVLGCPDELPYFPAVGRTFTDLWDVLDSTVKRDGIGLVIVDSLSRLGLGKLVDDIAANTGINLLNRLGIPWLATGHSPHEGNHVFGSIHWVNGARVTVEVEPAESPDDAGAIAMKLRVTKANHIRRGQAQLWTLRFAGDGYLVEHRRARPGEFVDLEVGSQTTKQKIVDVLRSEGRAMSTKAIGEELGMSSELVRKTCASNPDAFIRTESGGRGRGHSAKWGLVALEGFAGELST